MQEREIDMNLIATLRDTLRPINTNEVWGLIGFFLWIFLTWCLRDKKNGTGWFKASLKSLLFIIVLGLIVGNIK